MPGKPTYEELEQRIKELEKAESERKQEVNALREQVLNQITFMDASLDGIAIIDQAHRVRQANKRFAQMLGYTPEEVLGLHTWDWEVKMTEAKVRADFTDLSKTQTTFETRHRRKDGTIYDAEVTACGAKLGAESMALTISRDITDRKRAEEALRESEERYRAFFEQGLDGVVILEPKTTRIVEFNDQACRQLGYSREEFARLRLFDIDVKETAVEIKVHIQKVLKKGYDDFETLQRTKQGEIRHVHVTAQVIKIAGQSVYHCIWRDITDRKQAEKALGESDEKYRNLAENPFVGIFRTALDDGTFLYSNQKNAEIIGYDSSEDLIGRVRSADFYPSKARGELLDILQREKKVEGFETVLVLEDGTKKNISLSAQLWAEKGYLEGVIVDITERKRAEKAESEAMARFSGFAEASQYGMGMADLDGHIVYVNSTLARMLGEKSPDDCLGKHFPTAYYPSAMTRKLREEVMPALMRDGQWQGELELLTTDHRCIPTDENFFVIRDENGKPCYFADILTDISERKRAEADREKLHNQLAQAQKMESVGRLAGGVAHDFNNMLSVIIGYTDLAMEQAKSIEPIYAALKEIQKAANRSADVTRQLLAFARKQTIAPQVIDLNKIMESMLKMLRRVIGEDINLIWLPAADLWPVRVDPSQLDQVLVNLCVNARDAIVGVGKIVIETRNVVIDSAYCGMHPGIAPGDFILLTFRDNGCGMDRQTLDNLFEPFFTTKEVDRGTGLGLATVYGIVKQNNGFINVHSELSSGTTFNIYLPRHGVAPAPARKKSPSATDELGSETILLVEDELPILKMTTMMLQRLGYTVLTAQTPGEAVHAAREHAGEIHLLMTDVVMPEMNGRDLAKNILSAHPDLKCLFMSGYTTNVIALHGVLDAGVNFIQKPFSKEQLGAKVRDVLDKDIL